MKTTTLTMFLACALLSGGCLDEYVGSADLAETPDAGEQAVVEPSPEPVLPGPVCDPGHSYQGFGGMALEVGRVDAPIGDERRRMKPYSALAEEYAAALGETPALLESLATAFSSAPARWYEEPAATAISLHAAFRIAYEGCLTFTAGDPRFAAIPDASTAPQICTELAATFWLRTPTLAETSVCTQLALSDTAAEIDVHKRWSYVCASVLTSAGFLTY